MTIIRQTRHAPPAIPPHHLYRSIRRGGRKRRDKEETADTSALWLPLPLPPQHRHIKAKRSYTVSTPMKPSQSEPRTQSRSSTRSAVPEAVEEEEEDGRHGQPPLRSPIAIHCSVTRHGSTLLWWSRRSPLVHPSTAVLGLAVKVSLAMRIRMHPPQAPTQLDASRRHVLTPVAVGRR